MDVVVVGSCMTDLISYVSRMPKVGETIHGTKFTIGFGGKGANQAIACKRLGCLCAMVAKLGSDTFGEAYMKNFIDNEINCDYVSKTDSASTGIAQINVDDNGDNSIVIVSGSNFKLSIDDVSQAACLIENCKVLITQLEIDPLTTLSAMKIAKQFNVITIFNPAPAKEKLDQEFYSLSDYFCPNENETEMLTGVKLLDDKSITEACDILIKRGCKNIILTLGSKGAAIYSQTNPVLQYIVAEKVNVVDTTGAGDSFIGSLAFYLSNFKHLNLKEIVNRCCRIASISVCSEGTQTSFPKRVDLPEILFNRN